MKKIFRAMLRRAKIQRENERLGSEGQSTLEFALTLTLLMGFTFFYLQLALVFAWSNYIHYATFMSARAYLAAGPTRDDQVERARNVMLRTVKKSQALAGLDRFPLIAKGIGGDSAAPGVYIDPPAQFQPQVRAFSWMEGVRYSFKSRLFLVPWGGSSAQGAGASSLNSVELTAESWLGREPTTEDCETYMSTKGIYDNGC